MASVLLSGLPKRSVTLISSVFGRLPGYQGISGHHSLTGMKAIASVSNVRRRLSFARRCCMESLMAGVHPTAAGVPQTVVRSAGSSPVGPAAWAASPVRIRRHVEHTPLRHPLNIPHHAGVSSPASGAGTSSEVHPTSCSLREASLNHLHPRSACSYTDWGPRAACPGIADHRRSAYADARPMDVQDLWRPGREAQPLATAPCIQQRPVSCHQSAA